MKKKVTLILHVYLCIANNLSLTISDASDFLAEIKREEAEKAAQMKAELEEELKKKKEKGATDKKKKPKKKKNSKKKSEL